MDLDLEEWSLTDCTHTFSNLIPGSHYEITVTPVASMVRGKPATEQVHTSKLVSVISNAITRIAQEKYYDSRFSETNRDITSNFFHDFSNTCSLKYEIPIKAIKALAPAFRDTTIKFSTIIFNKNRNPCIYVIIYT